MSFRRKATEAIEKLEVSVEGKESPQTVAILKRFDEEIGELKKEVALLKKAEQAEE